MAVSVPMTILQLHVRKDFLGAAAYTFIAYGLAAGALVLILLLTQATQGQQPTSTRTRRFFQIPPLWGYSQWSDLHTSLRLPQPDAVRHSFGSGLPASPCALCLRSAEVSYFCGIGCRSLVIR